jgi:hypothetical protein
LRSECERCLDSFLAKAQRLGHVAGEFKDGVGEEFLDEGETQASTRGAVNDGIRTFSAGITTCGSSETRPDLDNKNPCRMSTKSVRNRSDNKNGDKTMTNSLVTRNLEHV